MRRRTSRVLLAATALTAVAVGSSAGAATTAATTAAPAYANHVGPSHVSSAGEPSIGVSWRTNAAMFVAGLHTARATFDAAGNPTWSDVSYANTSVLSFDPILSTDSRTGRTFVSQLLLAGSALGHTDDDGGRWNPSTGSGVPAGFDHQTVGGGPYPAEGSLGTPLGSYPHAVYYCSQETVTALCARSDDGGTTFGAGVPVYTLADCIGLHGHVKVGPDGTVYLPNKSCGGAQGVAVSRDAGVTWNVRRIPGTSAGRGGDPSVGTALDGTAYVGLVDGNGKLKVSVSTNHGTSFGAPVLAAPEEIENAALPAMVAGDGDRAAVAFLGTTTPGDTQNAKFGQSPDGTRYVGAEWHLYVSTTLDRGRTWKTVDLTPKDPVQRGRICLGGVGCTGGDRNLLDFMDAAVDRDGRVLVGWADGCVAACVDSDLVAKNTHTEQGTISRQTKGTLLFKKPQKAF